MSIMEESSYHIKKLLTSHISAILIKYYMHTIWIRIRDNLFDYVPDFLHVISLVNQTFSTFEISLERGIAICILLFVSSRHFFANSCEKICKLRFWSSYQIPFSSITFWYSFAFSL